MYAGPSSDAAGGRKLRRLSAQVAALLAIDIFFTELALAQELVVIGLLSCESQRVTGLLEIQRQKLSCSFVPAAAGPPSDFLGEIVDFGPPIGVTERTSVVFQVLTAGGISTHGLTGSYSNAS
jgi:Protein of unknown function (DUF992)